MLISINAMGQNKEPEFIGEINLVNDSDSIATLLEKQTVKIKTKAGASLYLFGIGSVKSRINIEGDKSNVRAKDKEPFTLIVRSIDNNSDPVSIISVFKFDIYGKARRAELSSSNTFGGVSENNLSAIKYSAKRYGKSSYALKLKNITPGEYGIIVRNPNIKDEKMVIVSCFGIDSKNAVLSEKENINN